MALSILAGRDRISLENGFDLRLLSALEILQARREGEELSGDGGERALCSNACLPGPGAGGALSGLRGSRGGLGRGGGERRL